MWCRAKAAGRVDQACRLVWVRRRGAGAQRQVMSLVGQYSPALFQEVFALLHEVVEGYHVADWDAVTVRSQGAAALEG